ncbi:MAG: hypothetical protein ACI4NV_04695 [Thermoguttaceae bacterium]
MSSSRSRAASEDAFSLFPFLAVLLCTMGTLSLVFVLVARKTSAEPTPAADDEAAAVAVVPFDGNAATFGHEISGTIVDADALASALNGGLSTNDAPTLSEYERALEKTGNASLEDVRGETENLDWLLSELSNMRETAEKNLAEQRARLANAEAAIAQLRAEAQAAQQKYEALVNSGENEGLDELKARLQSVDCEIEKLMEEAEKLREENADAKHSYAIVPYQGKKGTFRRPIFVECNADGVFIEPEGVKFDERDFLLAQYPGNPFDAALRAVAHRYLVTGGQKTASGDAIEPYPLIIVRPSGAKRFYAAIAALASWGELYGYEFVEEDQVLEYPQPDPLLAQAAQEQAQIARDRMQAQLAAALSARNAQIVALERSKRNASAYGGNNSAPQTELQARLGSNVRLGVARPDLTDLAMRGSSSAGLPSGEGSGLTRGGANAATPSAGSGANVAAAAPGLGLGVGGLGGGLGAGGNFSGAATGGAGAGIGGDTAPVVPYVGEYAQNVVSGAGEGSGSGETGAGAPSADGSNALGGDASQGGVQSLYVGNAAASGQESALASAAHDENTAPLYMKKFIDAPDAADSSVASQQDLSKTLGNSSVATGAQGTETDGDRLASSANAAQNGQGIPNVFDKTVDLSKEDEPKLEPRVDDAPKEAFLVSRELTRTATRGNERAVSVVCTSKGFLFPKQPGLRKEVLVKYDAEDRDAQLLDAVALCVKGWGLAGRNMYWAPYVKASGDKGFETRLNDLQAFCKAQGLTLK